MRDFFKSELKLLKAKTGLNQYENISAMPDAADQFKILFDQLEYACSFFPFIPISEKQRIITHNVMADPEFKGFNASIIYKWLNSNKDKFYKELAHMPVEQQAEPLSGEQRAKMLEEWENQLKQSVGLSVSRIPVNAEKEGKEKIEKKATANGRYPFTVGKIEGVYALSQEDANEIVRKLIALGELPEGCFCERGESP